MATIEDFFIKEYELMKAECQGYNALKEKYEDACSEIKEMKAALDIANGTNGLKETKRNVETLRAKVASVNNLDYGDSEFTKLTPDKLREIAKDEILLKEWGGKELKWGGIAVNVEKKVWSFEFKVQSSGEMSLFFFDAESTNVVKAKPDEIELGGYLYSCHEDELMGKAYKRFAKVLIDYAKHKEEKDAEAGEQK